VGTPRAPASSISWGNPDGVLGNRAHPDRFPRRWIVGRHLAVTHERRMPPGRLRARSERDRGLHLGRL